MAFCFLLVGQRLSPFFQGFKLALCLPSTAALWLPRAVCWTGPPLPQAHCVSAEDILPAPQAGTPSGSLVALSVTDLSALQHGMEVTAAHCFPGSRFSASCTGTALVGDFQSEREINHRQSHQQTGHMLIRDQHAHTMLQGSQSTCFWSSTSLSELLLSTIGTVPQVKVTRPWLCMDSSFRCSFALVARDHQWWWLKQKRSLRTVLEDQKPAHSWLILSHGPISISFFPSHTLHTTTGS